MVETGLGAKGLSIDVDIAPVFPTFHDDGGAPFRSSAVSWVGGSMRRHMMRPLTRIFNHESDAAKHFLLLDTAVLSYGRPHTINQSFIRWHGGCLVDRP